MYAASAPEHWVIYDSRVAAALTYLVAVTGPEEGVGHSLGTLPGKNPDRLRILPGFPRIWVSSHQLAFRSFVFASWMCRAIADRLNARRVSLPDGEIGAWKAYHVEMVLFMLGHDLKALPPLPTTSAPLLAGC